MPYTNSLMAKTIQSKEIHLKNGSAVNQKKGDSFIMTEINQLFASPLLNSHFKESLKAQGTLDKKIPLSIAAFYETPKSTVFLDDSHIAIDCQSSIKLINIDDGTIHGKRNKSKSMFITTTLPTIYSGNNQLEFFSISNFETANENYFIPGIGSYSALILLIPFKDSFIAGIQNYGNPKHPEPTFTLISRMYPGSRSYWKLNFEGIIPQPPVSFDEEVYIMGTNLISIINKDGNKTNEIKGVFSSVCGSIGNDGTGYMVLKDDNGIYLKTFDKNQKPLWEYRTELNEIIQPPVVSANNNVYIVSNMVIECINKGKKLWEYNFPGFLNNPFFVSSSSNNALILSKGNRIVCLDEYGKIQWDYIDKDDEIFQTQPVFDKRGRVIVASNKNIVVIK